MKWILIPMFIAGCMFSLAWKGADDPRQKRAYKFVAIFIWIVLLIAGNMVL